MAGASLLCVRRSSGDSVEMLEDLARTWLCPRRGLAFIVRGQSPGASPARERNLGLDHGGGARPASHRRRS